MVLKRAHFFSQILALIVLTITLGFQACSEKVLDSPEEGGFLLGSFADLVGTPCERIAVGLKDLGGRLYEVDIDQGGPIPPTAFRCLDFAGGKGVELVFDRDAYNIELATLMKNPNVELDVVVRVPNGITVGSKSVFVPALSSGILKEGSTLTIENRGRIQGAGGKGGHGGACGAPSLPGEKGGTALEFMVAGTINNQSGEIFGGGGGGGGGGDACQIVSGQLACAGGGAGGGGAGSDGGSGGSYTKPEGACNRFSGNFPGENGLKNRGGSSFGEYGGAGGDPGEPGERGASHNSLSTAFGQRGGEAGEAVVKNNNTVVINGQNGIRGPVLSGSAPVRNPIAL